MASQEAEALKEVLGSMQRVESAPSLEELRAAIDGMGTTLTADPDGVHDEVADLGAVRATWVIPDNAVSGAALQYLHGGGYCLGSLSSHRRLVGHIAKAARLRALFVEFRLAPEFPYPAAFNDSLAAYEWLLAEGYPATGIALAGDSGGGGLAVATMVASREKGLPLPAGAAVLSPWVDLECTAGSITTNVEKDLIVSPALIKMLADNYLSGADPHLASPIRAGLTGLPPLYIQAGADELLVDDARTLADEAARAGVEVTLDVFPEMQHVFQVSAGMMPEADDAVARIGAFIRERLGLEGD